MFFSWLRYFQYLLWQKEAFGIKKADGQACQKHFSFQKLLLRSCIQSFQTCLAHMARSNEKVPPHLTDVAGEVGSELQNNNISNKSLSSSRSSLLNAWKVKCISVYSAAKRDNVRPGRCSQPSHKPLEASAGFSGVISLSRTPYCQSSAGNVYGREMTNQ